MPKGSKTLLYIIGTSNLASQAFSDLPESVRKFLEGPLVQYVASPARIPSEAKYIPIIFLTSGGLEGYVQKRIENADGPF